MNLSEIDSFAVPRRVVLKTEEALRMAGSDGYELFVLWSGKVNGGTFDVVTPHIPNQESYKLKTGLVVRIDGEELHHLNVWLFENGETLGVQVHAHPKEAFHSDTDDEFPIVSSLGSLSVVAPNFCRAGILTEDTAVYRLTSRGWLEADLELLRIL